MNLHRLAAGLCLSLLLCSPLAAEENALPATSKAEVSQSSASGDGIQVIERSSAEKSRKDAFDALPEWEKRYVKDTRVTIENNIDSLMEGIVSRKELAASVDTFCRTWDKWEDSKLFILDSDKDIDVYGNLYSLQIICRTLRLAASDWDEAAQSEESLEVLKKAQWLEQRSRRLAEPVAEIIRHQSYSSYLPRRIEIMQDMLPYVDICYSQKGFAERMKKGD